MSCNLVPDVSIVKIRPRKMILRRNKYNSSILERITVDELNFYKSTSASDSDSLRTISTCSSRNETSRSRNKSCKTVNVEDHDLFKSLTPSQIDKYYAFVDFVNAELKISNFSKKSQKVYGNSLNCLRFAIARNFKLNPAVKMWRKWTEWYEEFRPDLVTKDEVKEVPLFGHFKLHKHDLDGNPLVVMSPGYLEEDLDVKDCKKVCIYLIQKACKKSDKHNNGKISVIFDRANMSQSKDKKWFPIYKMMSQTLQDYYPERLKVAYIINANWFTKVVISMVKVFLSKSTKEKICTIKNLNQLSAYFDSE
jgi:hypothetical protein